MKVKVYLPHSFETNYSADIIVGVDFGAFILAKKGVRMDLAIGDFDSTSSEEFDIIKQYSKKTIKLPIIKNETDSEAAVIYLKDLQYNDITLIGDTGSRLDHFLVNYRLVEKYDITYILDNCKIRNIKNGIYKIKREYQFLSLFTSDMATLSIRGVKYELKNHTINYFDTYTSANEIVSDNATIEVFSGSVTIVLSNDK